MTGATIGLSHERGSLCLSWPEWPGTGDCIAQRPRVEQNTTEKHCEMIPSGIRLYS